MHTHTSKLMQWILKWIFVFILRKGADRHLGDLGNVMADQRGIARVHIESDTLTLKGANSIVNRTLAVGKESTRSRFLIIFANIWKVTLLMITKFCTDNGKDG